MLAGRQHRDDDIAARGDDLGGLGHRAAGSAQLVSLDAAHVDALDLMTCLDEVLRHRQAHVAEPDESDPCHRQPPCALRGIT